MVSKAFTGGDALEKYLSNLGRKLNRSDTLKVGFLEGATYPDGTPVAYVAAIQEWGATINREAHTQTIYRQVNNAGTGFNKSGRFVKRKNANFASDHEVGPYTITIPARPFFRTMIAEKSGGWGPGLAHNLVNVSYDVSDALGKLGKEMSGQLKDSIRDWETPPNAPSTIAKKGRNKPLIDTGHMLNSVSYEVNT